MLSAFLVWAVAAALPWCGHPRTSGVVFPQAAPSELLRPLVFAHRGGGGKGPEATIPTMLTTVRRQPGVVIEFDVRRSRDGQLVVIHDATVDRTTNGSGPVADLTVGALKALDAGYCATLDGGAGGSEGGTAPRSVCRGSATVPFPFRGKGYVVPTLEEVLDALPPATFISMELKQAGMERDVARMLEQKHRLSKTIIGSESDTIAAAIKTALPEMPGYLPGGAAKRFLLAVGGKVPAGMSKVPPRYEVFASPLSAEGHSLDTRAVIDAAHCAGMAIVYWTINDQPTMERLFRLGADGVFTDFPDRGVAALQGLHAAGVLDKTTPVLPQTSGSM